MGDRKPKKNSSGNSDKYKAKLANDLKNRPVIKPTDKPSNRKEK